MALVILPLKSPLLCNTGELSENRGPGTAADQSQPGPSSVRIEPFSPSQRHLPHAGRLAQNVQEPVVLRRQGSGALLPAHAHLPSMVASEKLSPRLGLGACPEIKLLVSYGGHFEQVSRLGRVQAAAGPCAVI